MKFLGYGRQTIRDEDVAAVVAVLRGDYLTQGPAVSGFEEALAAYVGAPYAVVVANGTAALHLACLAAGLGKGDIGVTQAITFVASANCLSYCGAQADLVDIDPATINMSPEKLSEYLRRVPACKAVIPVAMGGYSHNGTELRSIAGDRIIIEDACHALGATNRDGTKVGGGTWADMTVFSFHPVKPITTGEGGAIITHREDLYRKLLALRSHGIVRNSSDFIDQSGVDNPWYYEMQELGFNYRLPDILAALGKAQLGSIDGFIARRREIAAYYDRRLADIPGIRLVQADAEMRSRSGHHLYMLQIDYRALRTTRARVMADLKAAGIGAQVHYIPVHHQPYYRPRFQKEFWNLSAADHFYEECLTIPCYPDLTDQDLGFVVENIHKLASRAESGGRDHAV